MEVKWLNGGALREWGGPGRPSIGYRAHQYVENWRRLGLPGCLLQRSSALRKLLWTRRPGMTKRSSSVHKLLYLPLYYFYSCWQVCPANVIHSLPIEATLHQSARGPILTIIHTFLFSNQQVFLVPINPVVVGMHISSEVEWRVGLCLQGHWQLCVYCWSCNQPRSPREWDGE